MKQGIDKNFISQPHDNVVLAESDGRPCAYCGDPGHRMKDCPDYKHG